jgi:hypothetical protein
MGQKPFPAVMQAEEKAACKPFRSNEIIAYR